MNELNFSDNITFIYIWSCLNIYSKYSATHKVAWRELTIKYIHL